MYSYKYLLRLLALCEMKAVIREFIHEIEVDILPFNLE